MSECVFDWGYVWWSTVEYVLFLLIVFGMWHGIEKEKAGAASGAEGDRQACLWECGHGPVKGRGCWCYQVWLSCNLQKLFHCVCFHCLSKHLVVPTVLIFIEYLRWDCCRVSWFTPHLIPDRTAHRDVNQLISDALTLQNTHHFCLLRLDLSRCSDGGVIQFDAHSAGWRRPFVFLRRSVPVLFWSTVSRRCVISFPTSHINI